MFSKTVIALSLMTTCGHSQVQIVGVDGRLSSEITFERACASVDSFLTALGFEKSPIDRSKARISRSSQGSWYILRTKSQFVANVDSRTGEIFSAYNGRRRNEQYKGIGRSGVQRFSSEQAAKNHLRAMATKCGVPATASLSSFGWKRDGEVKDANTSGVIWANYRIPGRESFQIEVDPQDGVFISFVHIIKRQ